MIRISNSRAAGDTDNKLDGSSIGRTVNNSRAAVLEQDYQYQTFRANNSRAAVLVPLFSGFYGISGE